MCQRGVLKPRSAVEGGDESVKGRARGQAQTKGRRRPQARSFTGSAHPSVSTTMTLLEARAGLFGLKGMEEGGQKRRGPGPYADLALALGFY